MSIRDELIATVTKARADALKVSREQRQQDKEFQANVKMILDGLITYLEFGDAVWYDPGTGKAGNEQATASTMIFKQSKDEASKDVLLVGIQLTIPDNCPGPAFLAPLVFRVAQDPNGGIRFSFGGGSFHILPNSGLDTAQKQFYQSVGKTLKEKIAAGHPDRTPIE